MRGQASGSDVALAATPIAASARASAPRLGYVDGLRALAALYVAASHAMATIWPMKPPSGLEGFLANWLQYPHFAVSVFIVLSGFSLMLPIARNGYKLPWGVWGFYWRRARRILPPYYFALALTLLLIWLFIGHDVGPRWDMVLPVTSQSIIEHILLIQDFSYWNSLTINFAFWSIAMECQIYVFFPLLILLWRRYPPLLAASVVFALSLAMLVGLSYTWVGHLPRYTAAAFAPQYFGLFGMGMFAASIHVKQTPLWTRLRDRYLWEGICLLGIGVIAVYDVSWQLYKLDLVVGLTTAGVLLAATRPARVNPIRAALTWRPLVWVGGFAYSIYLIHAPLIQLLWQYGLRPLRLSAVTTYLALLLVGVPLIVAASWLFWWWGERPFLNAPLATSVRMSNKNS